MGTGASCCCGRGTASPLKGMLIPGMTAGELKSAEGGMVEEEVVVVVVVVGVMLAWGGVISVLMLIVVSRVVGSMGAASLVTTIVVVVGMAEEEGVVAMVIFGGVMVVAMARGLVRAEGCVVSEVTGAVGVDIAVEGAEDSAGMEDDEIGVDVAVEEGEIVEGSSVCCVFSMVGADVVVVVVVVVEPVSTAFCSSLELLCTALASCGCGCSALECLWWW